MEVPIEYYLIALSFLLIIILLRIIRERRVIHRNMPGIFDVLGISSLLAYNDVTSYPITRDIKVRKLSDDEAFDALNYLLLGCGRAFDVAKDLPSFSVRELISVTGMDPKALRGWVMKCIELGLIKRIRKDGRLFFTINKERAVELIPPYIQRVRSFFSQGDVSSKGVLDIDIENPLDFIRAVSTIISNAYSLDEISEAPEYIKGLASEIGILRDGKIDMDASKTIPTLVEAALRKILGD